MLQAVTGAARHMLELAMQYNPVDVEQAADPQAQPFSFKEDPSADAHKSSWPHVLDDPWQNSPLAELH